MDFKPYIDLFAAALTPMIAITTVYIAYQQYRVNRINLRLNLYDRRVEVFRGVLTHLSAAAREAKLKSEDLMNFLRSTSKKEFLFDHDLCQYLEEIYGRSVDLWSASSQLADRDMPYGPERTQLVDRQSQQLKWLSDQLPELRKRFSKYLTITK